jgi:hypothetical protein
LVEKKATLPSVEVPSKRAGDAWAGGVHQRAAIVNAASMVFVTVEGIGCGIGRFGSDS